MYKELSSCVYFKLLMLKSYLAMWSSLLWPETKLKYYMICNEIIQNSINSIIKTFLEIYFLFHNDWKVNLHFIAQLHAYELYCFSFRHASPLGQFFRVASNELQFVQGYSSYCCISWYPEYTIKMCTNTKYSILLIF